MKAADIDRIHAAGLITAEQRDAIVAHFQLDHDRNRLLQILSILGGLLVTAGIILVIASNWDAIPKFVRLATALALMLGAHAAGWRIRQSDRHPALATSLHLIGSGLFLANIALVGQTYHLSSRTPNAFLLWWVGIAPLAWILRSKAQFILSLAAFGVWMATELNESRSWFHFGGEQRQMLFYAMLGLAFVGGGAALRRSAFAEFGSPAEKFGFLALHISSFPLTLGFFYNAEPVDSGAWVVCGLITVLAIVGLIFGVGRHPDIPTPQWRLTWAVLLGVLLGLAWIGLLVRHEYSWSRHQAVLGPHWLSIPLLFGFCLLQAQVGILSRNPFLLNLAITFIGLHLVSAYAQLFGTMFDTGLVFLVGGILLIALAVFLERKRRALMRQMRTSGVAPAIFTPPPAP